MLPSFEKDFCKEEGASNQEIINMNSKNEGKTSTTFIREVTAQYVGARRKPVKITDAEQVACFIRGILKDNAREHFIAIHLSGAHEIISYSLVSIGSANYATVHPREVFQPALLVGACAIVVAHNHPSDNLEISADDKTLTNRLIEVGKLIGIKILDHVIVTNNEHLSFQERRIL